jgi:NAD(P)-dependent dehydrogenase (short-subunit alcohol dehydrogenase family)
MVLLAALSWLTAPKTFPLRGKVVVITGGSSGIGKAIAKVSFPLWTPRVPVIRHATDTGANLTRYTLSSSLQEVLSRGASVALLARRAAVLEGECALAQRIPARSAASPAPAASTSPNSSIPRPALADAAKELRDAGVVASGQRISVHTADVTDEAAAAAAVSAAATAHGGRIDVVINSAGISQPRRFEETPAAEFLDVYKLNVIGTRNVTFAALPYMAGRNPLVPLTDGGRVMLISSQAGQAGLYGYTAYSVRAAPGAGPAGKGVKQRGSSFAV